MDIFSANTDVSLEVPLTDKDGNALAVTSISYSVIDVNGVEIIPPTPLADFVPDSETAVVVVPAEKNALAAGQTQDMRQVMLDCEVGGNTVRKTAFYAIQANEALLMGVNSFMSYVQAQFVALTMPGLDGWDGADEQGRIRALVEAWRRVLRLRFTDIDRYRDQSSLFYGFEGSRDTSWIGGNGIAGDLSLLRPDQYQNLPVEFMAALRNAQLCEANEILGGSTIDQKRRDGLIQDNIGESRQMFRQGKPLDLPVSRAALRYLSGYVSFALMIARA
jgi:hypothetical protein